MIDWVHVEIKNSQVHPCFTCTSPSEFQISIQKIIFPGNIFFFSSLFHFELYEWIEIWKFETCKCLKQGWTWLFFISTCIQSIINLIKVVLSLIFYVFIVFFSSIFRWLHQKFDFYYVDQESDFGSLLSRTLC